MRRFKIFGYVIDIDIRKNNRKKRGSKRISRVVEKFARGLKCDCCGRKFDNPSDLSYYAYKLECRLLCHNCEKKLPELYFRAKHYQDAYHDLLDENCKEDDI